MAELGFESRTELTSSACELQVKDTVKLFTISKIRDMRSLIFNSLKYLSIRIIPNVNFVYNLRKYVCKHKHLSCLLFNCNFIMLRHKLFTVCLGYIHKKKKKERKLVLFNFHDQ